VHCSSTMSTDQHQTTASTLCVAPRTATPRHYDHRTQPPSSFEENQEKEGDGRISTILFTHEVDAAYD
jgi:hypothetical protein